MKVYVYGIGKGKEFIDRCICDDVKIIAYVDNYQYSKGNLDGIPIIKLDEIEGDYNFLIVSLMKYKDIVQLLQKKGVDRDRIISFFSFKDANNSNYWNVLDHFKWHNELQWKHYNDNVLPLSWNLNYEIYADKMIENHQIPLILSTEDAVLKIKREKCSLARIGDGEFEQIRGNNRAIFQDYNHELSVKLREVLDSNIDKLIVAIADNYGSLEKYTDEAARAIREYLTPDTRAAHMELLDLNKVYYDAYISRPYIMYRDKLSAKDRFSAIREIWSNEDVLMVEGEHTRFGVGNDYLDNAKSINRIICPDKNAYSKYSQIYSSVEKNGKNKLILITLGPTATALAYDLAKKGYWAIDIGQIDTEYEWYLRGTDVKCEIPFKTVSEVPRYADIAINEDDDFIKRYKSEIIQKIF